MKSKNKRILLFVVFALSIIVAVIHIVTCIPYPRKVIINGEAQPDMTVYVRNESLYIPLLDFLKVSGCRVEEGDQDGQYIVSTDSAQYIIDMEEKWYADVRNKTQHHSLNCGISGDSGLIMNAMPLSVHVLGRNEYIPWYGICCELAEKLQLPKRISLESQTSTSVSFTVCDSAPS